MTITFHGVVDQDADNNAGTRSYSATYLLSISDPSTERPYQIGSHASLPLIGSVHQDDSQAYCNFLGVKRHAGKLAYHATARWETGRTLHQTDPAQDEVLVSFDGEIYQELARVDRNGDAIANSATDPFLDPAATIDATHLIARVQANVTAIPAWSLGYRDSVNDAEITVEGLVIPAGLAKFQRLVVGHRQYRNGQRYYPVNFELHVHREGWNLQPLDQGFRQLNSDGKPVMIRGDDGDYPTHPVRLDGNGAVQDDPVTTAPVFLDFEAYPERDFSLLPGVT